LSNPHDFHARQSLYTKEDFLKSSQGGYIGPRNAQLPATPMLMMDRIAEISMDGDPFRKGNIIGELDTAPSLWFFHCHFLGDLLSRHPIAIFAALPIVVRLHTGAWGNATEPDGQITQKSVHPSA
jgi:hypothetical protein